MAKASGGKRPGKDSAERMRTRRERKREQGLERVELWVPEGRKAAYQEMAEREVREMEHARRAGYHRRVLWVPEQVLTQIDASAEEWRRTAESVGALPRERRQPGADR